MFSKFRVFCSLITTLFLAKTVNCKSVDDTKYPCKQPFLALIYTRQEFCGGALLNELWISLSKECLEKKLRRRTWKQVKIGDSPNTQFRTVDATGSSCDMCSNIAVVKVIKPFRINHHVSPVKAPIIEKCDEKPVYIFNTYGVPWRASQSYCARIDVKKDCPPRTICGGVVGKKRSLTTKRYDDDRSSYMKLWGICAYTIGGPLMCKDQLLGFLLEDSCTNREPTPDLVRFVSAFADRKMIEDKIGEGDGRSIKLFLMPRHTHHRQVGGSLHGVFQTKILVAVMLLCLYIFIY